MRTKQFAVCSECNDTYEKKRENQYLCGKIECRKSSNAKYKKAVRQGIRKVIKKESIEPLKELKLAFVLCKCPSCGKNHYVDMTPVREGHVPRIRCYDCFREIEQAPPCMEFRDPYEVAL